MIETRKCVEFYLDPMQYNNEAILENIANARKEFPGKESKVKVEVNQWGMYRIKIEFYDKDNYLNNIKRKMKRKRRTVVVNSNDVHNKQTTIKQYGAYKQSGIIYKPY